MRSYSRFANRYSRWARSVLKAPVDVLERCYYRRHGGSTTSIGKGPFYSAALINAAHIKDHQQNLIEMMRWTIFKE
ncbi:unnamed protein product [Nezara viridula]|uniref:Uncharacterized protein n=1 Tax=Nezara viridula TaxID=85310 RepID=A0A9P0HBJ5_NEZVI|nr:unnamed protein product [Nezara viridula]